MDTDELSEEARAIFSTAMEISDFLRVDIGAMAKNFQNEDEYLKAVYDFVSSIKNDQTEYLEEWALEIPLDERKIDALLVQIDQLINTPQSERTYYNYE